MDYSSVKNESSDTSRSIPTLQVTTDIAIKNENFDNKPVTLVFGQDCRNKRPSHQGKNRTYFFFNNKPVFVIGHNKLVIVCFSFILLLAQIVVVVDKIQQGETAFYATAAILSALSDIFGLMIVFLNPGYPCMNNYVNEPMLELLENAYLEDNKSVDKYAICKMCNILVKKEENVYHCDKCEICVISYVLSRLSYSCRTFR